MPPLDFASVGTLSRSIFQEAHPLAARSNPINPIAKPDCVARFLRGKS
jgi:hypothetical protein